MKKEENNSLQKDIRRAFFRRIIIWCVIILVLVIVAIFVFRQFKTYSNARLALREAKNIKMSLEMIDMEYYGAGLSIYDDAAEGNIRKGAYAYAEKLQSGLNGSIKLTGYEKASRKITGFEYETEEYIVRYKALGDEESWQVCQIKEILTY